MQPVTFGLFSNVSSLTLFVYLCICVFVYLFSGFGNRERTHYRSVFVCVLCSACVGQCDTGSDHPPSRSLYPQSTQDHQQTDGRIS